MLTGPNVILTLKVAVAAVTVLLACSLVALARGHVKLHGRINLVFFVLTIAAVFGLEIIIRFVEPEVFDYIRSDEVLRQALRVHLCFAFPSALLMPVMLYTGLTKRRRLHLFLACLFSVAWVGTFVTGIFFLPAGR